MRSKAQIRLAIALRRACILVFAVCSASLFAMCHKADRIDNAILVRVQCDGGPVSHAGIYIKKDTLSNPGIPLSAYDYKRGADAKGEAYFDYLLPGKYYLYAQGYNAAAQENVDGEYSLVIKERGEPYYQEIIIETDN